MTQENIQTLPTGTQSQNQNPNDQNQIEDQTPEQINDWEPHTDQQDAFDMDPNQTQNLQNEIEQDLGFDPNQHQHMGNLPFQQQIQTPPNSQHVQQPPSNTQTANQQSVDANGQPINAQGAQEPELRDDDIIVGGRRFPANERAAAYAYIQTLTPQQQTQQLDPSTVYRQAIEDVKALVQPQQQIQAQQVTEPDPNLIYDNPTEYARQLRASVKAEMDAQYQPVIQQLQTQAQTPPTNVEAEWMIFHNKHPELRNCRWVSEQIIQENLGFFQSPNLDVNVAHTFLAMKTQDKLRDLGVQPQKQTRTLTDKPTVTTQGGGTRQTVTQAKPKQKNLTFAEQQNMLRKKRQKNFMSI